MKRVKLSSRVIFYSLTCLVTVAMFLLYMATEATPFIRPDMQTFIIKAVAWGFVGIVWLIIIAALIYLAKSWRTVGLVLGLGKGMPVVFLLLMSALVSQYGIEQVFEVGLAITLMLAPLVWVGIKWVLIIGALVVVVNLLSSAINKISRALDAVISNSEALERIEQKLSELKIENDKIGEL